MEGVEFQPMLTSQEIFYSDVEEETQLRFPLFENLDYTYLGPAFQSSTEGELALSFDQMIPRWVAFSKMDVPGNDWTAVPHNEMSNAGLEMLSQEIPSLIFSEANTGMQKSVEKQCDPIPL